VASDAFAALRDGTDSDDYDVERRRDLYEQVIFPTLEEDGLARDELQLAWDFVVGSKEGITGRMVHIRDDALERIGDGPAYTIDEVVDFSEEQNADTARRIYGTMTAPLYTEEDVLARFDGKGRFVDVAKASGEHFRRKFVGRGAAFGDYDNDGDTDILVLNLNDSPHLLRNEGHFAIYNFTDGQAFQPDFVLFLREKGGKLLIYQLFIEPKGRHLKEHDRWKETFLKEITSEFDGKPLAFEDKKYRLIGVPFYNNEDENQFRASLEAVLN